MGWAHVVSIVFVASILWVASARDEAELVDRAAYWSVGAFVAVLWPLVS